jgi:16S rRNA (cytosine1402-N4)-methyltransferase
LTEVVTQLHIQSGSRIIDATLGAGGHTAAFLERSAPDGRVLGLDADPEAIRRVQQRLSDAIASGRLEVVHANFGTIVQTAKRHGFTAVDAILMDLGVSSPQLDSAARGFSFMREGPLDMRMDPTQGISAADIVNTWDQNELADLIYQFGEERQSRRIARRIVEKRPFHTTQQLANVVAAAVGGRRNSRIHPATRTFQALRIAVNAELDVLTTALPQCLELLKPGGRLAVISFHSLEDRIVKQWMQRKASSYIADPTHPMGGYERTPHLRLVTRKPIAPSPAEVEQNPRSRSAKLRIAEKMDSSHVSETKASASDA